MAVTLELRATISNKIADACDSLLGIAPERLMAASDRVAKIVKSRKFAKFCKARGFRKPKYSVRITEVTYSGGRTIPVHHAHLIFASDADLLAFRMLCA